MVALPGMVMIACPPVPTSGGAVGLPLAAPPTVQIPSRPGRVRRRNVVFVVPAFFSCWICSVPNRECGVHQAECSQHKTHACECEKLVPAEQRTRCHRGICRCLIYYVAEPLNLAIHCSQHFVNVLTGLLQDCEILLSVQHL